LNLLEIVLSGKGQLIKDYLGKEVRIPFGLGNIPLFVTGIEFWLLYKLYTFQADLNDLKKFRELKYLEISIVVSLVLFIISNIRSSPIFCVNLFWSLVMVLCIFLIFC